MVCFVEEEKGNRLRTVADRCYVPVKKCPASELLKLVTVKIAYSYVEKR